MEPHVVIVELRGWQLLARSGRSAKRLDRRETCSQRMDRAFPASTILLLQRAKRATFLEYRLDCLKPSDFWYLPKSPKDVFPVEFSRLKIGRAAECNSTGMTEYYPEIFCSLYCCGRACALRRFASNIAAINKIEGQCNKTCCFGHLLTGALEQRAP
jgi:hypothetical protein